jgi:hypothetical protein
MDKKDYKQMFRARFWGFWLVLVGFPIQLGQICLYFAFACIPAVPLVRWTAMESRKMLWEGLTCSPLGLPLPFPWTPWQPIKLYLNDWPG